MPEMTEDTKKKLKDLAEQIRNIVAQEDINMAQADKLMDASYVLEDLAK